MLSSTACFVFVCCFEENSSLTVTEKIVAPLDSGCIKNAETRNNAYSNRSAQ